MSYKAQLNSKVSRFLSSAGSQGKSGSRTSFLETDLGADLSKLSDELLMKVCPTAVGYAATIVRKQAQQNVKNGGGANTIGMSRKTKTRGVMRGGRMVSVKGGGRNGKGSGAWSQAVLAKRGADNKSLADTGGIIKKRFSRKMGGIVSSQIVGPRYETGPKGKNFAHTHEPKGGGSGAPNHKWWGRPGKSLQARPWLIPAARQTLVQQQSALKKALMRWDIDPAEVTR